MSHLTVEQRYTIGALRAQSISVTDIAKTIGKHKSVVSRELRRNADKRNGHYSHQLAQRKYEQRQQLKPKKIHFTDSVKAYAAQKLRERLSPEQIAGEAKRTGPACVSAERIYQHVWQEKKKKGALHEFLRNRGKRYRKRGSLKDSRGIIPGRVSIEERPAIVEEKTRFGDLGIDTIIGKNHKGAIVTVNDRATGLLRMKKAGRKEARLVKEAAIALLQQFKPLLHTITADNGKEFAQHRQIAQQPEVDFFLPAPAIAGREEPMKT